ncbi:MAG TPA: FAD-dependent oxidoreductase [Kiritimatiellia bacterium]|mgnify:CR=1 FL=1|nr:FAD-dependent oxidoreductase [Kiritimatiellia bacterium]
MTGTISAAQEGLLRSSVPCRYGCPARTNVPAYLEAIAAGDFDGAYRINLEANVFPAVLGYVCTRPCEPVCRHGKAGNGESVAICFCKRSAAEFRKQKDPVILPHLSEPTGKKVAIVGGGVAGLTSARELARLGHEVTVYEKHNRPGGLMLLGIPHFRLPREVVEREIEQIRGQGVRFELGKGIGQDLTLVDLIESHDHVIIAAGALQPNMIPVPGADLQGVEHGLPFLFRVNELGSTEIGRRVLILGGGFTALDCARTAKRLATESVAIYYRRTAVEMYLAEHEMRELEVEDIGFVPLASPVEILGENGKVTGVRFRRTEPGKVDASGRRSVREVPGSEFDVPCESVLLGTGQSHDVTWTGKVIQTLLEHGGPTTGSHATTLPGVTKTGDFATGPRTLIDGIAHGKQCAWHVDAILMGRNRIGEVFESVSVTSSGRPAANNEIPRQPMPCLEVCCRSLMTADETGYDEATAQVEASRCYLCHYVYEIDKDACIFCHECLNVKPLDKCIVKISGLIQAEDGRITGYREVEGGPDYNQLYIDTSECIRCDACREVCPVDCIHVRRIDVSTQVVEGVGG